MWVLRLELNKKIKQERMSKSLMQLGNSWVNMFLSRDFHLSFNKNIIRTEIGITENRQKIHVSVWQKQRGPSVLFVCSPCMCER